MLFFFQPNENVDSLTGKLVSNSGWLPVVCVVLCVCMRACVHATCVFPLVSLGP